MARLYAAMEKAYPSDDPRAERDHEISVTLARILFLMFGDDTDMWAPDLFSTFIRDHTAADGSDIGAQLTAPVRLPRHPDDQRITPPSGLRRVPYVNGRIFSERRDPACPERGVPYRGARSVRSRLGQHQPSHLRVHVPVRPRRRDPPPARGALHL
jgi:hypothetical protein